jgi:ATP-grasp domain, R2K clade family 3
MEALALPNWNPHVLTPAAAWTWDADADEAWELARSVGAGPYIVKDHVKSCKEAWLEACFVPKGGRRAKFRSVCTEMMKRRGDRFQGGIVVRPFAPLRLITAHWSGAPIYEEYRLVFWRGKMILAAAYHDIGRDETDESGHLQPWRREAVQKFGRLGERIHSDYFVADVARTEDGELTLVEINDGSVAGFPPTVHPIEFYAAVAEEEERATDKDEKEGFD